MSSSAKGMLIVISGPSGVGKGTIYNSVLERVSGIAPSISATTRKPRGNEQDGREYFFMTDAQFDELIASGGLLEYAEVFGNRYGTPKSRVLNVTEKGGTVMLEIDVKGAEQIKKSFPDCVSVFIMPPSLEILEERLRGRATDSEASVIRRLSEAKREMEKSKYFDYVVFNDDLQTAIGDVVAIIRSERNRAVRNLEKIEKTIN